MLILFQKPVCELLIQFDSIILMLKIINSLEYKFEWNKYVIWF